MTRFKVLDHFLNSNLLLNHHYSSLLVHHSVNDRAVQYDGLARSTVTGELDDTVVSEHQHPILTRNHKLEIARAGIVTIPPANKIEIKYGVGF